MMTETVAASCQWLLTTVVAPCCQAAPRSAAVQAADAIWMAAVSEAFSLKLPLRCLTSFRQLLCLNLQCLFTDSLLAVPPWQLSCCGTCRIPQDVILSGQPVMLSIGCWLWLLLGYHVTSGAYFEILVLLTAV
jgi:hypothetical protein